MQSGEEEIGRALIKRTIKYIEKELPQYIRRPQRHTTALRHAAIEQDGQALDALQALLDERVYWKWRYLLQWPRVARLDDHIRFQQLQKRFNEEMESQQIGRAHV